MDRYERLASAFVGLADTLVADYDVIELAQQLIDNTMALLPISAAGILLGDVSGALHVFASSSEQSRLLELLQVEADVGPCLDAYRAGQAVHVEDLAGESARWPAFAERAAEYDFRAIVALPLRLRTERVGALNLFLSNTGPMEPADVAVGQALADAGVRVALIARACNLTLAQARAASREAWARRCADKGVDSGAKSCA